MNSTFRNRPTVFTNKEDKLVQCTAKSGQYSVKIGYQDLDRREEIGDWHFKLFWGQHSLPKAGSFAWLVARGRILTGERRRIFGFQEPTKCVSCEEAEKNVDHLL